MEKEEIKAGGMSRGRNLRLLWEYVLVIIFRLLLLEVSL